MINLFYPMLISIVLFALGAAAIAVERHLVVIVLAVELMLVASVITLVTIFSFATPPNPDALMMFLAILTVAAVEAIVVITLYIHMKFMNVDFDVTKLSRMKW